MIIVINTNVFILITMRIWQWTIHVVAFVVHGFLVEIKFGVLFYWGRVVGEPGGKNGART